jgi:serine/threonine protein kinase
MTYVTVCTTTSSPSTTTTTTTTPLHLQVLRHRMDELDQQMVDDFNREVSVMRSIRHPHLLILFGAGVDKMSRAFLVTELMAGSLKLLLLDRTTSLDWETRLRFASDIAQGMKYLADKETVHRGECLALYIC